MATAGAFAARIAELAYSTDDITYFPIEKVENIRLTGSSKTADTSSNDDNGSETHIITWDTGQLTFDLIADENATGQEALWTSFLGKTQLFYRVRPRGDSSGDKELTLQGTLSMDEPLNKSDAAKYSCTVQKTGALTRANQ